MHCTLREAGFAACEPKGTSWRDDGGSARKQSILIPAFLCAQLSCPEPMGTKEQWAACGHLADGGDTRCGAARHGSKEAAPRGAACPRPHLCRAPRWTVRGCPRGWRTRRVSATRPARLVADGSARPRRPQVPVDVPRPRPPSRHVIAVARAQDAPRPPSSSAWRRRLGGAPPSSRPEKRNASIKNKQTRQKRRSCTHVLKGPKAAQQPAPRVRKGGRPPKLRNVPPRHHNPGGDQATRRKPLSQ
ncbi:hypothetical protein BU14_0243s0010 [Porphyra umbilicalis]|uniref:Uncharacterized protein n=1 Tax=Porphyra umbilicalis TaxID=2786 RepID=A0A1X6P3D5_PORUM|nr:hypothetical protein BU14_0243s0010 [Porphyra umbilicalis]|eukprot:OSX75275.1 hypothetical protein BU14_0243s0010 [Porphyra umbilicalis]